MYAVLNIKDGRYKKGFRSIMSKVENEEEAKEWAKKHKNVLNLSVSITDFQVFSLNSFRLNELN